MPEGSTTPSNTNVRVQTRPQAAAPSPVEGLKKKYDDLAKQTTEAVDNGADPREVTRLKNEKKKAFEAFHKAQTDEQHAKRDANKGGGRNEAIDPGSPIVAQ